MNKDAIQIICFVFIVLLDIIVSRIESTLFNSFMYFSALSMYNPPSYLLAGGVQRIIIMENGMVFITHVTYIFLVLMLIGAGFMYTQIVKSISSQRSFYSNNFILS
jgi:hypothetical protein